MTKRKILFCEGNIDGTIGGSYFSLFFLVDGLDKTKYAPVVVFHTENALIPMYRDAGINVQVIELPKPVSLLSNVSELAAVFRKPLAIIQKAINFTRGFIIQSLKYRSYMRRNNIDLLHLNNSVVRNHPWMLAALLANVKCVTHERGINAVFSRVARFFGKRLNSVICISDAVKKNMVAKGFDPKNLVVIHNGIDPNWVKVGVPAEQIRKKYNIEENAPIIGIAGNIRAWKGQDVIVKATAEVAKKFPKIRCFIIGESTPDDMPFNNTLLKLVEDLRLKNNIIFTGYRKNVADYFNAMDVVLHSSVLPEPFGRVLIEAMALEKPLVAACEGAVPEIVENNVTGLTCQPGNVKQYADAIEQLLVDTERAREMGKKGREKLLREFHVDKNVTRTEQLYEQIFNYE